MLLLNTSAECCWFVSTSMLGVNLRYWTLKSKLTRTRTLPARPTRDHKVHRRVGCHIGTRR